jgi:hypothetical protein
LLKRLDAKTRRNAVRLVGRPVTTKSGVGLGISLSASAGVIVAF